MPGQRLRIAFVGVSPGARGGIAQFGANLVAVLAGDVDTSMLAYRRLYPRLARAGRQPPDPGAQPVAVAAAGIVPWEPWTWRRAARTLEAFAPDLIVLQWWNPLFSPCIRHLTRWARRSGSRTVVVCHNARPHERFPGWRSLTRAALRHADGLFALSDPVAHELRRLLEGRDVEVLEHPPNLTATGVASAEDWRARLGLGDEPVVLFFGNVRKYKGLEDLIDAFALVHECAGSLVVAGTFFEPLERFRRQVTARGIEGSVRFWPHYVASDEALGLFELCDLVVVPYRRASQSGVIAQAAFAGKPVVATAVGGLPAAVGPGGLVVPPDCPEALARAIIEGLTSPPAPPPTATWERWGEALRRQARLRRTTDGPAPPRLAPVYPRHVR